MMHGKTAMKVLYLGFLSFLLFFAGCSAYIYEEKVFTDEDYRRSIEMHKQEALEALKKYSESQGISAEEFSGPKVIRVAHDVGLYFHVRYYHPNHYFAYTVEPVGRDAIYRPVVKAGLKSSSLQDADCTKEERVSSQHLPDHFYHEEAFELAQKKLMEFARKNELLFQDFEEFGEPQITESNEHCYFPIFIVSYKHPIYYFHYSPYMDRLWAGKKTEATIDYSDVANLPFETGTLAPRKPKSDKD